MNNDLLFSIITITLNSEKYLSETIESVITEEYPLKEHIIIDGGSIDGTLDIIKSYGDAVRFISEPDNGISDAMNKGILMSKGNVVAHLHSDDRYTPGTLSKVGEAFLANEGIKWLCGSGDFIDEKGKSIKPIRFKRYSFNRLKTHNFLVHPSIFIRKEVFDKVGYFDTSLRYAMDYDMWLRIGKEYTPIQTDESLSSFRVHAGSLSTRESLMAIDEEYKIRLNCFGGEHAGKRLFSYLRYRAARYAKQVKIF